MVCSQVRRLWFTMKKANATSSKGGGTSSYSNYKSGSGSASNKNNNNKGTMGSYKSETKYSSSGDRDKYSSEQKYSLKDSVSGTKYSSQEKYNHNMAVAQEKRAQYKSMERCQNDANAARDKAYASTREQERNRYNSTKEKENKYWGSEKESDTKSKYSSDSKYGSKTETKSSWPSTTFNADAKYQEVKKSEDKYKYKYSSSAEDRWSSKNFGSDGMTRAFSSQSSTSTWEERNRGRAFPYDRDHELRQSQKQR